MKEEKRGKMEKIVLAKVGDIEITRDQMMGVLRNIPQEHMASVQGEEGRKRLLDEMIAGELLSLDAYQKKWDQEPEFLAIVEEAKHGLLQRYAINKLFAGIEIEEQAVQTYYEQHRDQFKQPEQAKAKHILVATEEQAEAIKQEIEAGKDFAEAAKQYSTCPSKDRGGDLGAFSRGQMVKEFEEAAFAAKAGELVGPIKTQFGYHLIQLEEIIPAAITALDQAAHTIKNQLIQERQQEVYFAMVDELKKEYPVVIHEQHLK